MHANDGDKQKGLAFFPVTFDFLECLSGGLRDKLPHDEQIWDTHQRKEEEGAGWGKRRNIGKKPWSQLTYEVRAYPKCQTCYRHCYTTDIVRVHFRQEDKHDGADGNRAAEHIENETYSYFNSFQ